MTSLGEYIDTFWREYPQVFVDRWYYAMKKDTKCTKGLFSSENFQLHDHGCLQQEEVTISIHPRSGHNFINHCLANLDCRFL